MLQNIEYHTITQASEKLGVERRIIKRLIKRGEIEFVKGKSKRSPYLIPETQLQHLYESATFEISADKEKEVTSSEKMESKSKHYLLSSDKYDDFVQIQKNLSETMVHLASTQEQIALTLAQLLKKG